MVRSWHLNVAAAVLALTGLTALFIGSAGDSWAAPNLLTNGGFATDVNNWTAVNVDADLSHDNANDRFGGVGQPGAALIGLAGAADGDANVVSECLSASAGAYPYTASVQRGSQWTHASVTPSTANSSYVNVIFTLYDSADCTGPAASNVGHGDTLLANAGWVDLTGTLNIVSGTVQSMTVMLHLHGQATGDEANFDEIGVAAGSLDTPTPSNTPTATNTSVNTNTPIPTNTGIPTDTVQPTDTPEIATSTNTPIPTDTPVPAPTDTPVPPTNTAVVVADPPEASIEETTGDAGAGGEQPEGAANAGEEQPEGAEGVPGAGYGPGSYQQGGSHAADVIAAAAFALAIAMLSAGFWLRKNAEQEL